MGRYCPCVGTIHWSGVYGLYMGPRSVCRVGVSIGKFIPLGCSCTECCGGNTWSWQASNSGTVATSGVRRLPAVSHASKDPGRVWGHLLSGLLWNNDRDLEKINTQNTTNLLHSTKGRCRGEMSLTYTESWRKRMEPAALGVENLSNLESWGVDEYLLHDL